MSRSLFFSAASGGSRAELNRDETARGHSTRSDLNSVVTDVTWYKLSPTDRDTSECERAPADCSSAQVLRAEDEIHEDFPILNIGQSELFLKPVIST